MRSVSSNTSGLCPEGVPPGLREHLPAGFELEAARHGTSSTVAFVRGGGDALVIKRATEPPYVQWLRVEVRVLEQLEGVDLPVPRVVAHEQGPQGLWALLTRLPGEPLCDVLEREAAKREPWLRRTGALLGRIHTTAVPEAVLERDSTPWWRRPRLDGPSASSGEVLGATRLHGRQPPPVFVHGDFTLDNVLVDDDGALGVVDWGGAGRGDPRYDLALALLSAGGGARLPPATEVRAFYEGYLEAVAGLPSLRESIAATLTASSDVPES